MNKEGEICLGTFPIEPVWGLREKDQAYANEEVLYLESLGVWEGIRTEQAYIRINPEGKKIINWLRNEKGEIISPQRSVFAIPKKDPY